MANRKDEAIQDILKDIESLSNIVLGQLDLIESIIDSGKIVIPEDKLELIMANEKTVNKKEVKLSEKVINTIVLYQPVASDLRRIMAAYRIINSQERISDLVINITNFISELKAHAVYDKLNDVVKNMISQSNKMVKQALLSYLNDDRELAIWTLKHEMVFEGINAKLVKKLIIKNEGNESDKHLLMSIINIKGMMSDIERIADHATNIAEAAIYYIDGKDIRHAKIPK